jgi:tetratricopeptide (TPR) repeat protein
MQMRKVENMPENDPRQLDLFEERTLRMMRGRRAFEAFDLREAKREFESCLALYPGDSDARASLAAVDFLIKRLALFEAETGSFLAALGRLGSELREADRKGWRRRLAEEAERRYGSGCEVDGKPSGLLWLAAGELVEAERSLRDSLQAAPDDARLLAYLGDALFLKDDVHAARASYLQAFLLDPAAVDLSHVKDPEVAVLPSVVENEYEIYGDFPDWIAAVGTVEGVFAVPMAVLPGMIAPLSDVSTQNVPGRSFYGLITEERAARSLQEKVPLRQKMKALCPTLFAAYLERFH